MRQVVAGMLLLAVLALAGCGDDVAPPQSGLVDEVAAHNGQVCPDQLPLGEDPDGYGFGTAEPADERPSLSTPSAAWVCRYDPTRIGPGPDGDGSTYRWRHDGKAQPVDSTRLTALTEHLAELKPADDVRVCTDDLGPRWMLVFTHQGDLTGVVIDDYGCRDIRLTDEPFETAPGDPGQEGTVPGVLSGPARLLGDLKAADEQTDQQPEDLWGRTFVSVNVTEGGEPRPLVSHDPIKLTFEQREPRGVVRWQASCNILGANVEITTNRLFLKEIVGTSMGCHDEDHEQDEWLASFFGSDPHWALNADRLTLTSGDTVIQLEARRDCADPAIDGCTNLSRSARSSRPALG